MKTATGLDETLTDDERKNQTTPRTLRHFDGLGGRAASHPARNPAMDGLFRAAEADRTLCGGVSNPGIWL